MGTNLVTDGLFSQTGDTSQTWQNDAGPNAPTSTDMNAPQATDTMGSLSPTGLANELRSIKSNIKGFALDPMWVNYTGDTAVAPSPNLPTYVSAREFTLPNGLANWSSIAVVGRAVRATFDNKAKAVARIIAADPTFSGNTATKISLDAPILSPAAPALVYVEFAAENPNQPGSWISSFDEIVSGSTIHFVLPVALGGTGQDNANAGGDLSGTYPNPNVAKIGNSPVKVPLAPTGPNQDVLTWNGTLWDAANVGTDLLNLAQHIVTNAVALTAKGYYKLPTTTPAGPAQLVLQWLRDGPYAVTVGSNTLSLAAWDTPFNNIYAALVIPNDPRVTVAWTPTSYLAGGLSNTNLEIAWVSTANVNPVFYTVIAIGV